mgnify:FL=1|jgi:hypothetical protein
MTPEEYTQLKAFARVDGAYLGVAWIISFAFYICGLSSPLLGLLGTLIAVLSPVFAAIRLGKFRDNARDGIISFRRAMAYYILMFLYASLLLALAQFVYFAYIDGGYLVSTYSAVMATPEAEAMLKAYGISTQQMQESISALAQTEPIYIVLNILSMNVTVGIILSLPAAAIMRRAVRPGSHGQQTNS